MRGRPAKDDPFFVRVYAAVRAVPRGQVVTYGGLALRLGVPHGARAVGWALRALGASGRRVPWHRVVAAGGRLSIPEPGRTVQAELLRREGVVVRNHRVDLRRHGLS